MTEKTPLPEGARLAPPFAPPFTPDALDGTVQAHWEAVVRALPDQLAVADAGGRLTYGDLDELAGGVVARLLARPEEDRRGPVAILCGEGRLVVVGLLGALKSGHGGVILPADSPVAHLRHLWEDALRPTVLTSRDSLALACQVTGSETACLVIDESEGPEPGKIQAVVGVKADDLALLSYTSGSTGEPKGVIWSHRLVLHTAWQNQVTYDLKCGDRCAVLASFGFGAAATQCFATLLSGASLFLPNFGKADTPTLAGWLRAEAVSVLAMPPVALLRALMAAWQKQAGPEFVRLVIVGGDELVQNDLDRFWECFGPQVGLAYRLASSETMVMREHLLKPGMRFAGKVPVGFAVKDKEVFLRDENGQATILGEAGEIVVRSRYLAEGYWRQPDLTAACFGEDSEQAGMRLFYSGDLARLLPDGNLEHLGRKDNLVKVRGYSVPLEAVETALVGLAGVREAVCLAVGVAGGERRLVAYLVAEGAARATVGELRKELGKKLAEHMLPAAYVWMGALPRTASGKVDRKALPPAPRGRPQLGNALVRPSDALEEALVRSWQDLLELDEVGVEDHFFELGGDSLLSIQMVLAAEELLGVKVPGDWFKTPTIARLRALGTTQGGSAGMAREGGGGRVSGWHDKGQRKGGLAKSLKRLRRGRLDADELLSGVGRYSVDVVLDALEGLIQRRILQQDYPAAIKSLLWVGGWGWVGRGFYREEYALLRRLGEEMGGDGMEAEKVFPTFLAGNLLIRFCLREFQENDRVPLLERFLGSSLYMWRNLGQLIAEAPMDELEAHFGVTGWEHLERARQAGRGVVLLTHHTTVNRFSVAALTRRLDGMHVPTISGKIALQGGERWRKGSSVALGQADLAAVFAGMALEGQRLLEAGRVVQFVSDNEYDQMGTPVVLAGRRYALRPGFAELALNTGARVVPQTSRLEADGKIWTQFWPALEAGSGRRPEQVTALVGQYADLINVWWREWPGAMRWSRLRSHFRQPPAG